MINNFIVNLIRVIYINVSNCLSFEYLLGLEEVILRQLVKLECLVVRKEQKFEVLIEDWLHFKHLLYDFMMDIILLVDSENVVDNAIYSKS